MSKFYWQQKWSNTVSLCKKTHRNAISNKKKSTLSISTTLSDVISQARSFCCRSAAEPLADACGTLGFRGTPVEKHWYKLSDIFTSPLIIHNWYMTSVSIAISPLSNWSTHIKLLIIEARNGCWTTNLEVVIKLDSSVQFPIVVKTFQLNAEHGWQWFDT